MSEKVEEQKANPHDDPLYTSDSDSSEPEDEKPREMPIWEKEGFTKEEWE